MYLGPYKARLILGYTTMFIGMAAILAVPSLVEWVIDSGIRNGDRTVIWQGCALIVLMAITQGAFTYTRSYIFTSLAERVGTDMRAEYYRKLQTLPFSFYDRSQSGQLMSRGTEDINAIRRFMMFSARMAVYGTVMIIAVAVLLFRADPELALLSLLMVPALTALGWRFGRVIRPRYMAIQQQFGDMSTVMQENLAGTRVVRVFASEEREIGKFEHSIRDLYDKNLVAAKISARYFSGMTSVDQIALAFILLYGGRQVVAGEISIGTLIAFNLYLGMVASPIRNLGWVINSFARAIASGDRIFEIIDTRPAVANSPNAYPLNVTAGRVTFDDVSFTYPHTEQPVLRDVSFEAEPGRVTALFGPTGSGKTSLVSLIPRFYDVSSGRVLIDGQDVRDVTLESLRSSVAIVMQDTFLFSSSIRGNIAFGRPDASDEEIQHAAKMARAHDFIMQTPHGYDTVLGERGVSLSGGQKQRLAIARAICMNPRILILDDATSSVDTETEFEIQQAMKVAMEGRTSFVIAQRLATLKSADVILVIENGRIVERGHHSELIQRDGIYSRVYELQLRDQEELQSVAAD
jgi:ATP-binding cassette subfamily B protein